MKLSIIVIILSVTISVILKNYKKPNNIKWKKIPKANRHTSKKKTSGLEAEKKLEEALKRQLPKSDWHILHNITLNRNDGTGTTQIDLLAISIFGIFVIEVKDFNGHVYANEGKEWFQYSRPGSKKQPFQNPHRQNYAHVMSVMKALAPLKSIEDKHIKSIVVFMGSAQYKGLPENTYTDLESTITMLKSHNEEKITKSQLITAIGLIEYKKLYDLPETDEQHISYLNSRNDPDK